MTGSHIRNAVDFEDYVILVLFWIVRNIQEVSEVEPFVFLHWGNADGTRTTCRLQGEGAWAPTTTWATAPMMSLCNAAHSLMALFRLFSCVQFAGRGGGCDEAVCPTSVPEVPVQGSQHRFWRYDSLLSKTDRPATSPDAGPSHQCFSLLLSYAGRGAVHPLGLEDVRKTVCCRMLRRRSLEKDAFVFQCCSPQTLVSP